jgi:hypothetical protein
MGDIFGPNSPAVESMLSRASALTETEGQALWEGHLKERARDSRFSASLSAVVDASHVYGRQSQMRLAELTGRATVKVFPGTSLGQAISGYVGRLAEALVVSDRIDAASIAPLTQPWLETIGPLDGAGRPA